uniref:Uncharacterized protein n=1 Tax=Timema shepardi TaxID=629360 RepID=A0A7R9AQQ4_TIMSH|nr:unnamed protein product [Timema shepardi]
MSGFEASYLLTSKGVMCTRICAAGKNKHYHGGCIVVLRGISYPIASSGGTQVFVPLIDCQADASPTLAAPDSTDPLTLFSDDGICLADGDWSMDYWNSYGLDTGLRDYEVPAVD